MSHLINGPPKLDRRRLARIPSVLLEPKDGFESIGDLERRLDSLRVRTAEWKVDDRVAVLPESVVTAGPELFHCLGGRSGGLMIISLIRCLSTMNE